MKLKTSMPLTKAEFALFCQDLYQLDCSKTTALTVIRDINGKFHVTIDIEDESLYADTLKESFKNSTMSSGGWSKVFEQID